MLRLFGAGRRAYQADSQPEEELVSLVGGRRTTSGAADRPAARGAVHLTLSIQGMHCSACSTSTEAALK